MLGAFTGSDLFGHSHTQPAGTSRLKPGPAPATDLTPSRATLTDTAGEAGIPRG